MKGRVDEGQRRGRKSYIKSLITREIMKEVTSKIETEWERGNKDEALILFSKEGNLIKHKIETIRDCKRGDLGVIGIKPKGSKSKGEIVSAVNDKASIIIQTSKGFSGQLSHNFLRDLEARIEKDDVLNIAKGDTLEKVTQCFIDN